MFAFNKILIITLLVNILVCDLQAAENIESKETKPQEDVKLIQLQTQVGSLGDTEYTYKCILGARKTAHVVCAKSNREAWQIPQNVELILRCPRSGEGPIIASAEIIFKATTQNVNCVVAAGGIGSNFIQMKVNVYGTKLMDYTSQFSIY